MAKRISQTILRPGELCVDTGSPVACPELHYLLAADWGSLTIRARNGQAQWSPAFRYAPDWGEIEEWLQQVVQSMRDDFGIGADGLIQRCLDHLRLTYGLG